MIKLTQIPIGWFAVVLLLPGLRGQRVTEVLAEPPGLSVIQGEELVRWAGHLASDEFGGRLTASPGQVKAAEYPRKEQHSSIRSSGSIARKAAAR